MDYGVIFLDDKRPGTELGNFAVRALDVDALKRTDAQIRDIRPIWIARSFSISIFGR